MANSKVGAAPGPNSAFTTTITSGQQVSAVVDMGGFVLSGLYLPSGFTGTTISFQAAATVGGSYFDVIDGSTGNTLLKTVAAGKYLPLDPADFIGIRFLKVKSGSAEAGDRVISLVGRTL